LKDEGLPSTTPGCAACQSELSAAARYCAQCGVAVHRGLAGDPLVQDDIRLVSILFADVKGFTHLSEQLEPEAIREILNGCFDGMAACVRRYGGTVDKYIGDCLMALFGAPASHGDDAVRSVRAALAMQTFMTGYAEGVLERYGHHLAVRIGICTGKVFAGFVGDARHQAYTVIGDAANVAERIESVAPSGGVLIGETTYRSVRGHFQVEALEPLPLKGKSQPVAVYRVIADRPKRSFRIGVRTLYGTEVEMIGRGPELAVMRQQWGLALAERCCTALTVVGAEGLGKSRLVHEFLKFLSESGVSNEFLIGSATPHGQSPLEAYEALVLGLARTPRRADPSLAMRRMIALCQGAIDEPQRAKSVCENLLLLTGFRSPGEEDWRATQLQQFRAVGDLIEGIAQRIPVFLVLEDFHCSTEQSRALTSYLSERLGEVPVFILCLARPEFNEAVPEWEGALKRHRVVELQPLSEAVCQSLVRHLLRHTESLPDALVNQVAQRADGNPFYVEEIIRDLVDRNIIRIDADDLWRLVGESAHLEVPATVEGVLQARLDRLSPPARELLHRAAVVGRIFWRGSLIALGATADEALDEHLAELERRELVFRRRDSAIAGEVEYIFKQKLVRDVAYANILKRQRVAYHREVARWLEAHRGGRWDDALLGYHYAHGEAPQEAVNALLRAGDVAAGYQALGEALADLDFAARLASEHTDLTLAVEWTDRLVPASAVIQIARGGVYLAMGEHEKALAELARAEEAMGMFGHVAGTARCITLKGEVLLAEAQHHKRSPREDIGELAICARDLAQAAGDDVAEFAARLLAGQHMLKRRGVTEAEAELSGLLEVANRMELELSQQLRLASLRASVLGAAGDRGGAEWFLRDALAGIGPADDVRPALVSGLLGQLAEVMEQRGERPDAKHLRVLADQRLARTVSAA
jgi:class 3 adenylate cyclase